MLEVFLGRTGSNGRSFFTAEKYAYFITVSCSGDFLQPSTVIPLTNPHGSIAAKSPCHQAPLPSPPLSMRVHLDVVSCHLCLQTQSSTHHRSQQTLWLWVQTWIQSTGSPTKSALVSGVLGATGLTLISTDNSAARCGDPVVADLPILVWISRAEIVSI